MKTFQDEKNERERERKKESRPRFETQFAEMKNYKIFSYTESGQM